MIKILMFILCFSCDIFAGKREREDEVLSSSKRHCPKEHGMFYGADLLAGAASTSILSLMQSHKDHDDDAMSSCCSSNGNLGHGMDEDQNFSDYELQRDEPNFGRESDNEMELFSEVSEADDKAN